MTDIYLPNVMNKINLGNRGVGVPRQSPTPDPQIVMHNFPRMSWHDWHYDNYRLYGYVPMVYNYASYFNKSEVYDAAIRAAKSRYILVGNEPETFDTAYSPRAYARLFGILRDKHPNKVFVGPNCNWNSTGLSWLNDFIAADGVVQEWGVHFYYNAPNQYFDYYESWRNFVKNLGMNPVNTHVTETAGNKNIPLDGQKDIMNLVKTLDVKSVFWFSAYYENGWENTALVNLDGSLTELGELWNED